MLHRDHQIARVVQFAGAMVMMAAFVWALIIAVRHRRAETADEQR